VFQWPKAQGGLAEMEKKNIARRLYFKHLLLRVLVELRLSVLV